MKFADLTINQTFTLTEYPDCIGVKVRPFGGSCCTPPHNAKLICEVEGVPQEKPVLMDEDEEVVPQPTETAVQPALLTNPTVLKNQIENKGKRVLPTGVKKDHSSIKDRQPVDDKIPVVNNPLAPKDIKGYQVNDPPIKVDKKNPVLKNPGGGTFGE